VDAAVTAPPGPLAEEAARLVEALAGWARGADAAGPADGTRPHHAGPECQVCPLCQLLALLRRTSPEGFAHLSEASAAFTAAVRAFVASGDVPPGRPGGVQRVDLDDPADDPQPAARGSATQ
jgi:hypothetical protein